MTNLWSIAKKKAQEQGNSDHWPTVVQIYKSMGGRERAVELYTVDANGDSTGQYELLGISTYGSPLAKSLTEDLVKELTHTEYITAKKLFKSTGRKDLSKLIKVQKLVMRKDGSTYMGTFYVTAEQSKDIASKKHITEDQASKLTMEDNDSEKFYRNKIAELTVDIGAIWTLQCQNLYSSKNFGALAVRESVQNSRDAINTAIENGLIKQGRIDINIDDNSLEIKDNGVGMDVQTLHTKFLELGGTTKTGKGTVGGFGQAKAVILGCGNSWEIHTRDNEFSSENLGKDVIKEADYLQGTSIKINDVIVGTTGYGSDKVDKILNAERIPGFIKEIKQYLLTSDVPNTDIYINGQLVAPEFELGLDTLKLPSELGVGSDIIPKGAEFHMVKASDALGGGYAYIRIGGLTQFRTYCGIDDFNVIIDLPADVDPKSPDYALTSSRESFKSSYSGITNAIDRYMNKNPNVFKSKEKYKETVFDNRDLAIAEERRTIKNVVTRKEILDAMTKIQSIYDSMDKIDKSKVIKTAEDDNWRIKDLQREAEEAYDGETTVGGRVAAPTIGEVVKQQNDLTKRIMEEQGLTVEEAADVVAKRVMGIDSSSDQTNANPLEFSWLVWEDKDREDSFDAIDHIELLSAWDLVLRRVQESALTRLLDIYPGFILSQDVLGMAVTKTMPSGSGRKFVLFNPEMITPEELDDDMMLALHLKQLACHELAHHCCGSLEGHDENHSYMTGWLDRKSNLVFKDLLKIVKETGIRKELQKLHTEGQKQKIKKEYGYKLEEIKAVRDSLKNVPYSTSVDDLVMLALMSSNRKEADLNQGDVVYCVNTDNLPLLGTYLRVDEVDSKTGKAKVKDAYSGDRGKAVEVSIDDLITTDVYYSAQRKMRDLAYTLDMSELESRFDSMSDNDSVSLIAYNWKRFKRSEVSKKYIPYDSRTAGYYTGKNGLLSSTSAVMDSLIDKYIKNSRISGAIDEDEVYRIASKTMDRYREMLYDLDRNEWNEFYNSDAYSEIKEYFKKEVSRRLKGKTKAAPTASTSSDKKPAAPAKELTDTEKKINKRLSSMKVDDFYGYALELGIDLDAFEYKYPNPGIRRMRVTMEIKKILGTNENLIIDLVNGR